MTTATSFGAWIRQRRRTLDMTQEELAAHVGCSLSAIRKIEADDRRPSRQVAELLSETLRIPQEERSTFLRIARMELAIPNLATLEPALTPSYLTFPLPTVNAAHGGNGANATFFPRGLPTPPTPLVGRAGDVARVTALLSDAQCRLLTLVGPGGVGKTRLAIAAADALRASSPDGVVYVGLAAVDAPDAPDAIVAALAGALGFAFHGATQASTQLISFLRPKRLLMVLDNLEHLLEGVDLLSDLLQQALDVKLLVTSREPLGLPGEWVFDVHGLPVPPESDESRQILSTGWEKAGAVQLFLQAARRANPEFAVNADDQAAIVRICQLVEGMPLGIELAAAWVRMLSCQEIATEIAASLDFLHTTARGVPARQRSLRAAFDYSWRLLEEDEQIVLRRLAVFNGGFTRAAAAEVAGASLLTLSTLLTKSLVHRDDSGRYHLHETVRQYAAEKLVEASEGDSLPARHFHYLLMAAQQVDTARNRADYLTLVSQLIAESDNIQAALTWAFAHDSAQALRLVGILEPYFELRPVRDTLAWLQRGLEIANQANVQIADDVQARLLWVAATFAPSLDRTMGFAHQAQEFARRAGDLRTLALALSITGNQGILDGNYAHSAAIYVEAQQIAEQLQDNVTLSRVFADRAELERYQGNYGRAVELCSTSLSLTQAVGRADLAAAHSVTLAKLALRQGDPQRAQSLLTTVLSRCETPRDSYTCSLALLLLARAKIIQTDYDAARSLIAQSQAIDAELGYEYYGSFAQALLGELEMVQGNLSLARSHYEQSIDLVKIYYEPMTVVLSQRGLASVALRQGDRATAEAAIAISAQISQSTNECWNRALVEYVRSELLWLDGDRVAALAHFRAGLEQLQQLGDLYGVVEGLEHVALVLGAERRWVDAARLLSAADSLRTRIGAPVPVVDRPRLDTLTAEVRQVLGADFTPWWEAGAQMARSDLAAVIALAMANENCKL